METKKISIIVPAYNIEEYLGRCLESILAQTYKNLEILVVDDGSKDTTGKILDQYAAKDARIVAIHQKNQGVSAARNNALDRVTGDYIGFVDGDDLIESDMYEILVDLLESEKVDIAHCGYQMVFPSRVDYYYNSGEKQRMNKYEGVYELLKGAKIEPGLWNKLYKAELFKSIRLPVGIQETEDLLCNYYLFMRANSSYFYDIPKYHYMIRNGSATTVPMSEKKHRDRLYVTKCMYEDCKEIPSLRATAYEKYVRIIMENEMQNDWPKLQKESRIELKKECPKVCNDKEIGNKFKVMVIGQVYLNAIYRLIRKLHDRKTGVNHKYDL